MSTRNPQFASRIRRAGNGGGRADVIGLGRGADLVGREGEMTVARRSLRLAATGHGHVLLITGEAGLGKTRLATELATEARARGLTVLSGSCSEVDLAVPYLPLNEAIDNMLAESDPERLRAALGPLAEPLTYLVPGFLPRQEVPPPADPATARLRLFEAVLALLRVLSSDRGLVLVVDDVHWADASTLLMLDFLARRVRTLPVLLVVTYRLDEVDRTHAFHQVMHGWRRANLSVTVELGPLSAADVGAMLSDLLGVRLSRDLVDLMATRSEGNPFVVEELLKATVERGDIYRHGMTWRRKPLADMRIPATVTDSIMSRLGRLDSDEIAILQVAAILGRAFDVDTLVLVMGGDEDLVPRAMAAAVYQRLIEEHPPGQLNFYRFRHALTHEAISSELPPRDRSRLHSQAADVLASRPGTAPVELARHLLAAGRTAEASPVCLAAAGMAESSGAFVEAAELYRRALPGMGDQLERSRVLGRLGRTLIASGQIGAAIACLEEAVTYQESAGEVREAAVGLVNLGRCLWLASRREEALQTLNRARVTLEMEPPGPMLALLYAHLSSFHEAELEAEEALDFANRALAIAEAVGADEARIVAMFSRGWSSFELGRREDGLATIDQALAVAIRLHRNDLVARCALNAAWVRGHAMRAREIAGLSLEVTRVEVGPGGEAYRMMIDALGARWLGDLAALDRSSAELIETANAVGMDRLAWYGSQLLAIARIEQDRLPEAEALIGSLAGHEAEDVREWWPSRVRLQLARATPDVAATEARGLLALGTWAHRDPYVVAHVVEALVAAGDVQTAMGCADVARAAEPDPAHPFILQAWGASRLGAGEAGASLDPLMTAATALEASGYRLFAARCWALVAEAQRRLALGDAAASTARAISLGASCGARLLLREIEGLVPGPEAGASGSGGEAHPATIDGPPPAPAERLRISPREQELLALLAVGKTDQEIARQLFIAVATVRSHLDRIREKTGCRRRSDLTRLAIRLGLVSPDEGQG